MVCISSVGQQISGSIQRQPHTKVVFIISTFTSDIYEWYLSVHNVLLTKDLICNLSNRFQNVWSLFIKWQEWKTNDIYRIEYLTSEWKTCDIDGIYYHAYPKTTYSVFVLAQNVYFTLLVVYVYYLYGFNLHYVILGGSNNELWQQLMCQLWCEIKMAPGQSNKICKNEVNGRGWLSLL